MKKLNLAFICLIVLLSSTVSSSVSYLFGCDELGCPVGYVCKDDGNCYKQNPTNFIQLLVEWRDHAF